MAHFPLIEEVLANVETPHKFHQLRWGKLVFQCHLCPVEFLLRDPTSEENCDTRAIRVTRKQYDAMLSRYKSHYISHTMENGQQRLLSSAPNATSKSAESTQLETPRFDLTEASKSNDLPTFPAVSDSDYCT
jgi:ketopantoate reductase